MRLRARSTALLASAILVVACGGGATVPSGDESLSPTANDFISEPPAGSGSPSGTSFRIVNAWGEPGALGPSVVVLPFGAEEGAVRLAEVAPGTVSEFVDIPLGFGDSLETLEIFPADEVGGDRSFFISNIDDAEKVTWIVHGGDGDGRDMAASTVWDVGDPNVGGAWPEVPADKATVMIYPGALLSLDEDLHTFWYGTGDGSCLTQADTGEPEEFGFGGNTQSFFTVEPGTVEIQASSTGCDGDAAFDPATFDVAAGDRVALVPYGTGADDLSFLVLPMAAE